MANRTWIHYLPQSYHSLKAGWVDGCGTDHRVNHWAEWASFVAERVASSVTGDEEGLQLAISVNAIVAPTYYTANGRTHRNRRRLGLGWVRGSQEWEVDVRGRPGKGNKENAATMGNNLIVDGKSIILKSWTSTEC